jgi:hypothetical protein
VDDNAFTLHTRLWVVYRQLPRLLQVWIVLVLIGALVAGLSSLLSGTSQTQRVRDAVARAVNEATGSDPASSCTALSSAGLAQVVGQFGQDSSTVAASPLAACEQLVVRLSSQADPLQIADFARGSVRAVQFRANGSALVLYVAADRRLAVQLTMSQNSGRWLIDSVAAGTVAARS